MNKDLFQEAKVAYTGKDYEHALLAYTQCLEDNSVPLETGELGLLYHQIGNCLVKVKDYAEAIHAYTQAAADSSYDAVGAVNCNLGMAYGALRDYEDAVQHYEIAVSDANYDTPYKAYMGLGNALLKLGKSAEAGSAFRSAALDDANPNPVKALLNLGVCFMALNRPSDAVASYENCLQFQMDAATRNKLNANLGQAYTESNQMEKAVEAFERALADKTYYLNDAASVDYQRAVGSVAQGTAVMTPIEQEKMAQAAPLYDMSGLDVPADGAPVYHETDTVAAAQDPHYMQDSYGVQDQYSSSDERFFNASEAELERWGKNVAKQDRKRRNIGLKILVVLIVVILLAFAAGVFAYTQGYGYPMQKDVATQLFADKSAAKSGLFVNGLSDAEIDSMLDPVVEDSSVTVNGVDRSMTSSSAYVTAKTSAGGEINYKISMSRDGIGWKISNIELYFPSQG